MSTHKKIDSICIAATIFAIVLTMLLIGGSLLGIMPAVSAQADSDFFTANDLNADWDTSSATKITLSDKGSTISGNGAYVNDGDIYIAYPGHYVLTGESEDSSVIIDADRSDKIWISLDGVTLHCEDGAAIRVEQADKVFLTLAEGSSNTLSSGAAYDAELAAAGVDGTIYSRDDLTINGTGTLMVTAAYNHGIVCNDSLAITGGSITIDAVQDGIHANDSVCIRDAWISISAGDDGITVSNDDETAFLYIESGTISIPACYEGLEAIEVTIAGGTIDIWPTDDGINANGSGAASVIRITGGDIRITNPSGRDADGLDSNGSIYIEGGYVFVSVSDNGGNCALDYGSENGGECVVSGGTVIACGGSAMAEGFDSASPQGFLMYGTTAAAGTTVSLTDSLGVELLSEEIPCSFSSVVISTPKLQIGDTCTITVGDMQDQLTIDNTSSSGFMPAGMFGGGMRGGRGRDGMAGNPENESSSPFTDRKSNDSQDPPPQADGQDMSGNTPPGADNQDLPQDSPPGTDGQGMPQDSLPGADGQNMTQDSPPGADGQGMTQDSPPGADGQNLPQDSPPGADGQDMTQDSPPGADGQNLPQGASPWADGQDMEPPGKTDGAFPDGEMPDFPNGELRGGNQDARGNGGKAFMPDAQETKGNDMHFPQQGWGQTYSTGTASNISANALALVGISVLALLIGLLIALKIKH